MNFGKKLQYDFPKMRGGSKAVWNFSENSSVLDVSGIPKQRSALQESEFAEVTLLKYNKAKESRHDDPC